MKGKTSRWFAAARKNVSPAILAEAAASDASLPAARGAGRGGGWRQIEVQEDEEGNAEGVPGYGDFTDFDDKSELDPELPPVLGARG